MAATITAASPTMGTTTAAAAAVVHAAGASAALEAATSGINISISINGAQGNHYGTGHQHNTSADLSGHLNFASVGASTGSNSNPQSISTRLVAS